MDVQIDSEWMLAILLVATRLAGVFAYSPVLGFNQLPPRVRVTVILALTLIFGFGLPHTASPIDSIAQLTFAVLREFLIGALLGLGVFVAFAAMTFAGQLLDTQVGFNVAVLFDYNTQAQNPLLSTLFGMLAGAVFLALDAHHLLLQALAQTFDLFPLGGGRFSVSPALLSRQLGVVFLFGLMVASPVALGVLLLDVATAFVSRSMPQLNIYFVTLPLKIFWGLLLLSLTVTHAGPVMQRLFSDAITASLTAPV
jgi:flagellar biosynthetic protein FliR